MGETMKNNRLKLDFTLRTAKERKEFIDKYILSPDFQKKPLNNEELEMIGNYLLWGQDEDGKNVAQRKEIFIKTKRGDWDNAKAEDSLEELMESPAFNEATLTPLYQNHHKVVKETFSRSDALKKCPDNLREEFLSLFRRIDELELLINFYEIRHNKRNKPPRKELLNQFSQIEINDLEEKSAHLNAYDYLKKRHILIDLRREQYILRDTYQTKITKNPIQKTIYYLEQPTPTFDNEINVFPFGIINNTEISKNIFIPFTDFSKKELPQPLLRDIIDFYWKKKEQNKKEPFFDFGNKEHLYYLTKNWFDFNTELWEPNTESTVPNFFKTFEYYLEQTNLSELEKKIFELKVKKVKNCDIAAYLKKEYNKNYTQNYISTIFKQKILGNIAATAMYHMELVENLPFPENFKQCYRCGNTYLRDNRSFVHKRDAKDGLANRCKLCDKELRRLRNEKYKTKSS